MQYPEQKAYLAPRYRGRIILSRDPDGGERCVGCYLCAVVCPVDCIALQATEDENGRRFPEWFRINFSRCIFCGFCEDACPTYAIQLTPDVEMSEYHRQNMVYEKEHLLIDGPGKYPGYNFWRVSRCRDWREGQGRGRARGARYRPPHFNALRGFMDALFYIAAVVAILATVMVITRLNAVHALLYLIVSLLSVAVVFYTLGAPFIAALEVIIYAGAIMVLFVFVVMMLNLGPRTTETERIWLNPKMWIGPCILSAILIAEVAYLLSQAGAVRQGSRLGWAQRGGHGAVRTLRHRRGTRFHAFAGRSRWSLSPG